jgi:uncharacterized membrane protein YeaQ/YmgE (transglycosylase-associated protein family)
LSSYYAFYSLIKEGVTIMLVAALALADVSLSSVLWWLIVGLIAGALASMVMRGGGYGIIGDIVVGLVGALLGGFLASLIGLGASSFIGEIIVAFIGACVLIAILRAVSGGTRRV